MSTRLVAADVDPEEGVMLRSDFTSLCRHVGLRRLLFFPFPSSKPMYDMIWLCSHVRYNLAWFSCTIQSGCSLMYDINLRATYTTILSIRGVTIPIYLVSSAMDSIRQRIVLFKPVPVPASDPKSEFLCQSSLSCTECNGHYNRTPDLGKCEMWWNTWDLARHTILDTKVLDRNVTWRTKHKDTLDTSTRRDDTWLPL